MIRSRARTALLLATSSLVLLGCPRSKQTAEPPPATTPPASTAPAAKALTYDALDRASFNKVAVRLNLALFWIADHDADKAVDPAEVATLRFYPQSPVWVEGGKFTPAFDKAYAAIKRSAEAPQLPAGISAEEKQRRELVVQDLDQGRPTLIHNDFSKAAAPDRTLLEHMFTTAALIDDLFELQLGLVELKAKVPDDDLASQSMFRRNWGPDCVAPKTTKNPACSAIPGAPRILSGVYPSALQQDEKFCDALAKRADAQALFNPFVVVQEKDGKLVPAPYTEAFAAKMSAVAAELKAAAAAIADPKEGALKAYLLAAAQAFTDNNWEPADEAWAKMNAENSRWYLRVAPDEVYWDPCSRKAGFHLTFARVDPASLKWQQKLKPVQQEMEQVLAKLIGKPYQAREVGFHLPDFIEIVLNAGDDRGAMGGTLGQSLPNWGPVANEGRGRTVVMTNLYTDPDSLAVRRAQVASLLDAATLEKFSQDQEKSLVSTILHEAAHNLGPAHEYKVKGKTDDQIFGGPLSSTLEELKAQTAALWYTDFLVQKKIIDQRFAHESYVDDLTWSLGHISRGMYTADGKPRPYSQLAAIQLGYLMDKGAIRWDPEAMAANGKDKGAFTVHFEKLPAAIEELMKHVGQIKARGQKAEAAALVTAYVDSDKVPKALIAERFLRYPKANFLYSVTR